MSYSIKDIMSKHYLKTDFYNLFFQNGIYSNGEKCLYELKRYIAFNGHDFAIFKRGENNYRIGHNCNFDFNNFNVSWSWGHYDFSSIADCEKWIYKNYK